MSSTFLQSSQKTHPYSPTSDKPSPSPQAAKTLQFTLTNTQLGQTQLAPPDAFEAALLDANTHNPLIATPIGLNGHLTMDGTPVHPCPPQTDSFLNLQAGGTSYLSPKVLISGTNLNNKRIVSLDISQLTPGTSATSTLTYLVLVPKIV